MDRKGRQMIQELKTTRPDVAISVTRFEDYVTWDGDGPDPSDEGYTCYTHDVIACSVRDGILFKGESSLGGSWYRDYDTSETAQEIGGYLPQMVDEALEELERALAAHEEAK